MKKTICALVAAVGMAGCGSGREGSSEKVYWEMNHQYET
jgi:hypothetical protein